MKNSARLILLLAVAGLLVSSGCAPTTVEVTQEAGGVLPQPDKYLVYNFSVSPHEVELYEGISAKVKALIDNAKTNRTEQELQVGHDAANALAEKLVAKLRKLGYPAERARELPSPNRGNLLLIEGQIISINEGNRAERVIIGLGAGRTDVKSMTQLYELTSGKRSLIMEFDTDAKSGAKPGMLETEGASALAGHWATGLVVGSGVAVAGEKYGAGIDDDADRTAEQMAKRLNQFFISKGWVPVISQ